MERGYQIPGGKEKVAFLIEKGMPKEGMLKVLAMAKEARSAGKQVLISNMKKNKKFQKEQLEAEGYTTINDCYVDRILSM
jgi:histidyl-tRNA synthetase